MEDSYSSGDGPVACLPVAQPGAPPRRALADLLPTRVSFPSGALMRYRRTRRLAGIESYEPGVGAAVSQQSVLCTGQ